MIHIDLGLTHYQEALLQQETLFSERLNAKAKGVNTPEDTVILTEHFPVFTLGKSGKLQNLLMQNPEKLGIEMFFTSRGGDITFHGPGQLVVYPILDLERLGIGLAKYVFILEESVVELLKKYDITAGRSQGATGVWLPGNAAQSERKICAIGIKASRHITMHGIALNVHTNLQYFDHIIPCGIQNKGVTSIERELGYNPGMNEIKECFTQIFSSKIQQIS